MAASTSVHSNAFNFMSFLQSGVDPRTGQYTVSINLPELKTNDLRGPEVPLALIFNPLNTVDSGFGHGWDLKQTQYNLRNQVLSLYTGESFKVTGSEGDQLVMKEQKLDSFHFYQDPVNPSRFRVMHKSGLVEILEVRGGTENRVAVPVEVHSPEGHKVTLDYVTFNNTYPLLSWIKDDADQLLLTVVRNNSSVEVLLLPEAGPDETPVASFVMTLEGTTNHVTRISLPTENLASWRFGYELVKGHLCMVWAETPVGGREEMAYGDGGHNFPEGSLRTPLPRVTRHLVKPGAGQPDIENAYTYPEGKNFLGFTLRGISWNDDGQDNLYQYIGPYEYGSIETLHVGGQAVQTIERKFNQFHLLTSETTTRKNNVHTVETTYFLDPEKSFVAQPKYFQLPKDVKTSWSITGTNQLRSETASSTYDSYGNLLTQTHATGVVETSTWHPIDMDPEKFVRHLKDLTVTPASSSDGEAPTLRTHYRYKALPPIEGSLLKHWLTVESETLVQVDGGKEVELERTVFVYNETPKDAFLHGRVKRQTVTMKHDVEGTITDYSTITDYGYSKLDGTELKDAVLQTVETLTGFDHGVDGRNVKKEVTLQHSILNGETLRQHDDNNVIISYIYDALRRVISETVAPGTDFAATRRYTYFLCANAGEKAEQHLFDVKGVETCTEFDGLNRAISERRADADNPKPGDTLRQTYAAKYDAYGQMIEETEYDWLDDQNVAQLTRFEFDDWGAQYCVISPDGIKAFEETDPTGTTDWRGPIQRSWREGPAPNPKKTGVTETWLNLFEKPAQTKRLNLGNDQVSLHQYFYDGLGRTRKEVVGFGTVQRTTLYEYDNFDRLTLNTLPDANAVVRTFAPHSREDLPTLIRVKGKTLGTQTHDGLGRMIGSNTGGRVQLFAYEPGQTQPKSVTTPSGKVIEYGYQPQLGTEPILRCLPPVDAIGEFSEATYDYDLKNARLVSCQEQGVQLTRDYFSTGEPKSETRIVEGVSYTMDYRYSRLGRLLSYTDVLRQEQTYRYDAVGRLEHTELGDTASTFTYDSLGRTATIVTHDKAGAQTVGITLEYDEFDRETLRSFDLNGVKQTLSQVYNDVDNLSRRTLKEGTVTLRDEMYYYDLRGRLVLYECSGTQPPVDPCNKKITSQSYLFDEIDNLLMVTTEFDGDSNIAFYHYGPVDPAQLYKVENTHKDYPPLIELTYNEDGHLIRDEKKRTLKYDPLGRLISVSALPGETPGSYSYDPLDKVSGLNGQGGPEKRFYLGDKLASQIKGANSSTFMRGDDAVLAEHQAGADPKSLLMAGDDKNSVLTEVSKAERKGMVYAPYGHRADDASVSSHLGFNGERREGQTGWYMLGNGYRVFNTVLGRFHSPDSWSPFGKGGVNAYGYVEGNPVGNTDSTGHFAWPTFGSVMRIFGIATKGNKTAAEMAGSALKAQGSIVPVTTPKIFAGAKLAKLTQAADGSFDSAATKFNDFVDFKASEFSAVKVVANYNKVLDGVAKGKIFAKPPQIKDISAQISKIQNEVFDNSTLSKDFFDAQPSTNPAIQLVNQAKALGDKYPRYETPENIMKAVRQIKSVK